MQIFTDLESWTHYRASLPASSSVGLVPTMGHLHAGHLSLLTASQQENDLTVATIFINPTQFNQREDFEGYPRTMQQDLALLENHGVDLCLLPNENAMYADDYRFRIQDTGPDGLLEDKCRPGHFTGVLTVVMKLLNLIKPHRAYFGEKDFQQYMLIHDMARAFLLNIEIKACPTIREASGLAYSSRNSRLTPAQRRIAEKFASLFHQSDKSLQSIRSQLEQLDIHIEYLEEYKQRRYVAIRLGEIRLIDNYAVSECS